MPAPHTTAAAAAAATAVVATKGSVPVAEALPPPQLLREGVEEQQQHREAKAQVHDASPGVSAAALEAIADVDSVGEASGDAAAVAELVTGLRGDNLKTIPCSFLYDGPGSALYDAITELPSYYPYDAEVELLDAKAADIAAAIPRAAVLVELGCGSANKTPRLLSAVARKLREEKDNEDSAVVRYAGIDVSADFLENARQNVTKGGDVSPENVETFCLRYLEGARAARAAHEGEDLCFLWLGSSVGNLDADSAAAFVRELFAAAKSEEGKGDADADGGSGGGKKKGAKKRKGKTQLLLCTDLWKDEKRLRAAYDDGEGVTAAFMRNGLRHALACVSVLADDENDDDEKSTTTHTKPTMATTATTTTALRVAASRGAAPADWRYEVVVNPGEQQVEMYLVCPASFELRVPKKKSEDGEKGDDDVDVVRFAEGERVLMEVSRKYTLERIGHLAESSGVKLVGRWVTGDYGIQLLE